MRTIMVRYKTQAAYADANQAAIEGVFEALRASAPDGIRYASYRLPDGASFLHIATVVTPAANPLVALPAFQEFQARLEGRCVEAPVVTELSPIGAYAAVRA